MVTNVIVDVLDHEESVENLQHGHKEHTGFPRKKKVFFFSNLDHFETYWAVPKNGQTWQACQCSKVVQKGL